LAGHSSETAVAISVAKGLLIFGIAMAAMCLLIWLFQPVYRMPPIAATGGEITLIVEGGKELDGIIAMLTTLTTGLFVLVALVARSPVRPSVRASPSQMVVLAIFGLSAVGSFYSGFHAKYMVAEGLLGRSINLPLIQSQIGMQAWFTAFAGAAAIALIAEALLTVKT
jgi:hypothetical protein